MRNRIAVLAMALWAVVTGGCGGARPSSYYQLDVPNLPPPAGRTDVYPAVLLVGRLTAPHLFRDDRIVYRTGTEQLGAYEHQRWAAPPTEMLETMLLRMLRASGRYRTVQLLRSNAQGEYIVRGRLHDLEEISGRPMAARVAFEIELYEIGSGTTVWSHSYARDEPVDGKDVAAVVKGMNRNVQHGLEEVTAGIDQYFSTHPPK